MLQEKLGDPVVAGDSIEYQKVAKAAAGLQEIVDSFRQACDTEKAISEAKQMLKDSAGMDAKVGSKYRTRFPDHPGEAL